MYFKKKTTFVHYLKRLDSMKKNIEHKYVPLFEDNYLVRTLSSNITSKADIALTELVANAWDAGATTVSIFIPEKRGEFLIIEDNGSGLTKNEFQERWMTLGYNKLAHQGKYVLFPDEKQRTPRIAYGKNGIGRHSLLCFNDEYDVITSKNGVELTLTVSTRVKKEAISVIDQKELPTKKHGTRLEVRVERNLPNVKTIREIISSRFLHDPEFIIEINKQQLSLDQLDSLLDIDKEELTTADGYTIIANFIDSKKAARKSIYQGIAFWQGGRLVGSPSWVLGTVFALDGRTAFAKRYTIVIQSNDIADLVKEDWSGFKNIEATDNLYRTVANYVNTKFEQTAKANLEETKTFIQQELAEKLKKASPLARYEADEIIESITINTPTASKETISIAVEAVLNLEATKNGQQLLSKLSKLTEQDVADLNTILEKWTVKDALVVLTEIDRRLSIIEAIRKLSKDKNTDELHVLHPLITEARWLFGPEYDTPEYTSNRQLQTIMRELFKKEIKSTNDIKIHRRPDLVSLADNSSVSMTGIEDFDDNSMVIIRKVLLLELKRGGFEITSKERNQATEYVESMISLGLKDAKITAFVIGDKVAKGLVRQTTIGSEKEGTIFLTDFDQLVDTAEKRMFGLRDKLAQMYDDVSGMDLYHQTCLHFT